MQDNILFSGTIAENIATAGRRRRMRKCMRRPAANAHEFIVQNPQGYGAMLGERGMQLSGGQRQRLAIARVILKNPKISSSTKPPRRWTRNPRARAGGLERLMEKRTSIVIAHRLSTIVNASRILVLKRPHRGAGASRRAAPEGRPVLQLYTLQFARQDAAAA